MKQHNHNGPGLHKEVSAIFDGVPLSNGGAANSVGQADLKADAASSTETAKIRPETDTEATASDSPQPVKPIRQEYTRGSVKSISARKGIVQSLTSIFVSLNLDDADTRRQKIMALLIPVLLVTLVLVFVKVLGGPSRTIASTVVEEEPQEEATIDESEVDWKLPALYAEPSRDPMKSELEIRSRQTNKDENDMETETDTSEQQSVALNGMEITGILYSKDRPAVIVGTEILHEGDNVLGAKIVKIYKDCVEFELDGKRWKESVRP